MCVVYIYRIIDAINGIAFCMQYKGNFLRVHIFFGTNVLIFRIDLVGFLSPLHFVVMTDAVLSTVILHVLGSCVRLSSRWHHPRSASASCTNVAQFHT